MKNEVQNDNEKQKESSISLDNFSKLYREVACFDSADRLFHILAHQHRAKMFFMRAHADVICLPAEVVSFCPDSNDIKIYEKANLKC